MFFKVFFWVILGFLKVVLLFIGVKIYDDGLISYCILVLCRFCVLFLFLILVYLISILVLVILIGMIIVGRGYIVNLKFMLF